MSRHLHGLNPPQKEAVLTISGPLLVLAGAGTGKTRVVTCRIAETLSRGLPPSTICAVTFTNKAAREMRERLTAMLKGQDLSQMVISTFHSLGLRILRRYGTEAGFPGKTTIADESDQLSILTDVLRESGISRKAMRPQDARWRISGWKNAGTLPDDVIGDADNPMDGALGVAYERYDAELKRRSLLDFDDLILKPLMVFKNNPDVLNQLRSEWLYMLVDEYQDTNECQYQMVRDLAGPRQNLCVVGDDDQSIYAWRGADPKRILRFTRDFPKARVVTLEQNYRSTSSILDAANSLILSNLGRREKKLWSALGEGEKVVLYRAEDEKDELDFVVGRIATTRHTHGLRFQDVAILFRANSQCRPLEQALRARDMPYKVVGTRSFFDRREVRDLLAFLRVIRNPKDDSALLRIINVPPRGIGKGSVDKLIQWAADDKRSLYETVVARGDDLPRAACAGTAKLKAMLEGVENLARTNGVGAGVRHLVEELQYKDHLAMTVDDALELQTRQTVVDDLLEAADSQRSQGSESLDQFLDALSLRDEDRKDKEDDSDAITLLTMHAAKGLEFPMVFLVGLEEGLLPHANSINSDDIVCDDRALEEERRLFYVGMTRAQRRLILSHARRRTRFGREQEREMSRFLEEIGLDQLDLLDARDDKPADPETGRATFQQIRAALKSRRADETS